MSGTFRFLCVEILKLPGGFMRTMVNRSSDLCRVNPDSQLGYLSNLTFDRTRVPPKQFSSRGYNADAPWLRLALSAAKTIAIGLKKCQESRRGREPSANCYTEVANGANSVLTTVGLARKSLKGDRYECLSKLV